MKNASTLQWVWDQSDQGNRISSDGRNTWNRAGLIPDPLCSIARHNDVVQVAMDLGSGKSFKQQASSLTGPVGDDRMNLERNNMDTTQLKRIADAIEEILRLVKKDMEPREKKKN